MAAFDLIVGSKFKPFSYSDMITPVQMADTEHRTIEENLGELSTKSGVLQNILDRQRDKQAYSQYEAYINELTKQADLLSKEGLNSNSRRGLLDARRQYSSNITPIEMAIQRREQLTKEQRDAISKDPSLMFNTDYSVSSIDDILNNPNASYNSISGAELAKRTSQMAKNLSRTIQSNPEYESILGGQYFQRMQQLGYTPQQVMQTILNDANAPKELKNVAETVFNEAGLSQWDRKTQDRAREYISSGLYDAIGTQSYDVQNNKSYMSPADQKRFEMEQERFNLYKDQLSKDKSTIPLNDGSVIRVIGGGKALRIYPDGRVENYVGNSGIKGAGIKEAATVGDTPIIIANTNGKWRIGEQGKDVKGTLLGMTRSNTVSSWGNYSLDNINTRDIVTDYNEIPKGALDAMLKAAKDQKIDIDKYDIMRVKAKGNRASGKYDYVLIPKVESPQNTQIQNQSMQNNFNENIGL